MYICAQVQIKTRMAPYPIRPICTYNNWAYKDNIPNYMYNRSKAVLKPNTIVSQRINGLEL